MANIGAKKAGDFGNFSFSLSRDDQAAIQTWLRNLPPPMQGSKEWSLLHALTYTKDWTEAPKHPQLKTT